MRVVSAGVHGAVDLGRERQPGVLGHRQRVHVAAQEDRRTRPGTTKARDHRGRLPSRPHLEAEPVESLEHRGLGPRQREASLRLSMNAPAELDGVAQDGPSVFQDRDGFHEVEV